MDDPHLAAALHFIHDHLSKLFGIDQVVRTTSISHRQLEKRFRRAFGCTRYDYLSRKRIEPVKQLLSTPGSIKLHNVVTACGFSSVERMRLVFKRQTEQPKP